MSATRLQRPASSFHADPKFGRVLLVSLVAHGLVLVAFSGGWLGSAERAKPPAYFVDLVHKPVLDPQAGRPEPRPAKKKPAPVKREAPAPVVKKTPEPVAPPKAAPAPRPEPQPTAKPTVRDDSKLQEALEELRREQERQADLDALRERLARLKEGAAATVPEDVPVGMPEGTGTEVGASALEHVRAYIQQNWALSPYLLGNPARMAEIEARVQLVYSPEGSLVRYRILEPSGDSQFDDSLKRAIIKSKQLEHTLPKQIELTVVFNLKEMVERR